jgi:antirestriction protein
VPELYANPYSGSGFYFSDLADYEAKVKKKRGDFEHTIMFIDGDDDEQQLFTAMSGRDGLYPIDLEDYYDVIDMDDGEKAALYWLLDNLNMKIADALGKIEDVGLHEGSAKDWAYDFIEEVGVPGNAADYYFDYDRFGRDLSIDGALDPDPDDYDDGEDDPDYIEEEERISALSDEDYGVEYVEVYGGAEHLPKQTITDYFDYDAWIRDLEINGEIATFSFAGTSYVVDNAASL